MKVAIFHDFLNQLGGAERVLGVFHEIFPEAPIYTLIHDSNTVPNNGWNIRTNKLLNRLFNVINYKYGLFLYPHIIERILLRDYDLVISSSYTFSKSIKTQNNSFHVVYCYTPMRFAHEDVLSDYIGDFNFFKRKVVKTLVNYLKEWDISTSSRAHYYVAPSFYIADKIRKYYNREARVIYPGVDTSYFDICTNGNGSRHAYFLIVSRLVPYKRIDLAIKAFNILKLPLKIIGVGPEYKKLKTLACSNIEFMGRVSDEALRKCYREARALVLCWPEDFGIAPVEAQACGKPVIAFRKGGILETVIEGETGIYFDEQNIESLIQAVRNFDKIKFNAHVIRKNALRFDKQHFKKDFFNFINLNFERFNYLKNHLRRSE